MSQIGQQAMPEVVSEMEAELPLIIYSHQLMNLTRDTVKDVATCKTFYQKTWGIRKAAQTTALCMNEKDPANPLGITRFNFYTDPMTTSRTWINLFQNNATHDPADLVDLMYLLNLTASDVNTMVWGSASLIQKYIFTQVYKPIFDHYNDPTCKGPACAGHCSLGANQSVCTNKELTYLQWINGTVLANPPASLGRPASSDSYITAFPDFTSLHITPELGFFLSKAEISSFNLDVSDVITFMRMDRLFNQQILGDILLNLKKPTYKETFTNPSFARYIRFIIIEQGLNGIFQYRTPREYIEGFTDPTVYALSQTPVYAGGDQTVDPFMAINQSPTSPVNNTVVFFTGTDDYMYTRRMARWLDQEYITIKKKDYDSISTLSDSYVEPWIGRDFVRNNLIN